MSRNFGLGSRNMERAVKYGLQAQAREGLMSYSTAATVADRFARFATWSREHGARYLEYVTPELATEYGRELADLVTQGELSPAYAQNLVSAVNTAMSMATNGAWKPVSPTKDCQIGQRSLVRETAPASLDRTAFESAARAVESRLDERAATLVELIREFGLRSKEASLLDCKRALQEAGKIGQITISAGTKGGRTREVPIVHERQLRVLERAASTQGKGRSLMPGEHSWRTWREGPLRAIRETLREVTGGDRLHDLRAAYAIDRYQHLTRQPAPVTSSKPPTDRDADRQARRIIAQELGHNRAEITNAYLGGRR